MTTARQPGPGMGLGMLTPLPPTSIALFQGVTYQAGSIIPVLSRYGPHYNIANVRTGLPLPMDPTGTVRLEGGQAYTVLPVALAQAPALSPSRDESSGTLGYFGTAKRRSRNAQAATVAATNPSQYIGSTGSLHVDAAGLHARRTSYQIGSLGISSPLHVTAGGTSFSIGSPLAISAGTAAGSAPLLAPESSMGPGRSRLSTVPLAATGAGSAAASSTPQLNVPSPNHATLHGSSAGSSLGGNHSLVPGSSASQALSASAEACLGNAPKQEVSVDEGSAVVEAASSRTSVTLQGVRALQGRPAADLPDSDSDSVDSHLAGGRRRVSKPKMSLIDFLNSDPADHGAAPASDPGANSRASTTSGPTSAGPRSAKESKRFSWTLGRKSSSNSSAAASSAGGNLDSSSDKKSRMSGHLVAPVHPTLVEEPAAGKPMGADATELSSSVTAAATSLPLSPTSGSLCMSPGSASVLDTSANFDAASLHDTASISSKKRGSILHTFFGSGNPGNSGGSNSSSAFIAGGSVANNLGSYMISEDDGLMSPSNAAAAAPPPHASTIRRQSGTLRYKVSSMMKWKVASQAANSEPNLVEGGEGSGAGDYPGQGESCDGVVVQTPSEPLLATSTEASEAARAGTAASAPKGPRPVVRTTDVLAKLFTVGGTYTTANALAEMEPVSMAGLVDTRMCLVEVKNYRLRIVDLSVAPTSPPAPEAEPMPLGKSMSIGKSSSIASTPSVNAAEGVLHDHVLEDTTCLPNAGRPDGSSVLVSGKFGTVQIDQLAIRSVQSFMAAVNTASSNISLALGYNGIHRPIILPEDQILTTQYREHLALSVHLQRAVSYLGTVLPLAQFAPSQPLGHIQEASTASLPISPPASASDATPSALGLGAPGASLPRTDSASVSLPPPVMARARTRSNPRGPPAISAPSPASLHAAASVHTSLTSLHSPAMAHSASRPASAVMPKSSSASPFQPVSTESLPVGSAPDMSKNVLGSNGQSSPATSKQAALGVQLESASSLSLNTNVGKDAPMPILGSVDEPAAICADSAASPALLGQGSAPADSPSAESTAACILTESSAGASSADPPRQTLAAVSDAELLQSTCESRPTGGTSSNDVSDAVEPPTPVSPQVPESSHTQSIKPKSTERKEQHVAHVGKLRLPEPLNSTTAENLLLLTDSTSEKQRVRRSSAVARAHAATGASSLTTQSSGAASGAGGVMSAWTLEDMLAYLLDPSLPMDGEFAECLVFTYRHFSSFDHLLDAILRDWETRSTNGEESPQTGKPPAATLGAYARVRVMALLRVWIEVGWPDFEGHHGRQERIVNAIRTLRTAETGSPTPTAVLGASETIRIANILEDLVRVLAHTHSQDLPPAVSLAAAINGGLAVRNTQVDFLTLDPQVVATQLAFWDHFYMLSVRPRDVLLHLWGGETHKGDEHKRSLQNLSAMVDRFNQVSYWVATEICTQPMLKKRVKAVEMVVRIAKYCIKLNDYNAATAIVSGLNLSAVARLRQTWAAVDSKHLDRLKEYENLLGPANNYKQYRSVLDERIRDVQERFASPALHEELWPTLLSAQGLLSSNLVPLRAPGAPTMHFPSPPSSPTRASPTSPVSFPGVAQLMAYPGNSAFSAGLGMSNAGMPQPNGAAAPFVPFIGLFLKDLLFMNDGNAKHVAPAAKADPAVDAAEAPHSSAPRESATQLVNVTKLRMIHQQVRNFILLQHAIRLAALHGTAGWGAADAIMAQASFSHDASLGGATASLSSTSSSLNGPFASLMASRNGPMTPGPAPTAPASLQASLTATSTLGPTSPSSDHVSTAFDIIREYVRAPRGLNETQLYKYSTLAEKKSGDETLDLRSKWLQESK